MLKFLVLAIHFHNKHTRNEQRAQDILGLLKEVLVLTFIILQITLSVCIPQLMKCFGISIKE